MELTDVIAGRHSIRKFKPESISDEKIQLLLTAARLAPSGSNLQPWRFIVAKSPEAKELIGQSTPFNFITKAAVIFVCCADLTAISNREKRIIELEQADAFRDTGIDVSDLLAYKSTVLDDAAIRSYLVMNVAIAVEHIVLKAVDLGLGSCWIGRFDGKVIRQVLRLDKNIFPVVLLPVGYADQSPRQRPRLAVEQLVIKEI